MRDGVVNEGPVSTRLGLPGNPADGRGGARRARHPARGADRRAPARRARLDRRRRRPDPRGARARHPRHRRGHAAPSRRSPTRRRSATTRTPRWRRRCARRRTSRRCRAGLADGTIDAIATDHAPHAVHEKDVEFTAAPPGVIGLETAVPVTLDLVRAGELAPLEWVRRLSTNPGAHHPPRGRLARGRRAGRRGADRSGAALGLRPGEGLLEEPQLAVGRPAR